MSNFFTKKSQDIINIITDNLEGLRGQDDIIDLEKNFGSIEYLIPYYVIPSAQNLNPADTIDDDTGLIAKNDVFNLLDAFLSGHPRYSHAFVLSDAGMGKTSLLTIIKISASLNLTNSSFNVYLFKLGTDTLDKINGIPAPTDSILLLDALDEDKEAWDNFYTRLQMLLQHTKSFRKVIITCRTQFFPHSYEEDGKVPGQISLHGFHCSKVFLSPFDDLQVSEYINKRFKDQIDKDKAFSIVKKMRSLRFRPMLLSYIDFLLEEDQQYLTAYDIYEQLVNEWLNRELRKGVISNKDPLKKACEIIAFEMYLNGKSRTIEQHTIVGICNDTYGIKELPYLSVEGRSLLNITSDEKYKFAHFSIQEFFVANKLINWEGRKFIENTDQVINFVADLITKRKVKNKNLSNFDLKKINLNHVSFNHFNLKGTILSTSNIGLTDFASSELEDADLSQSNFTNCCFDKVQFIATNLEGCSFEDCSFQKSLFKSIVTSNIKLQKSIFTDTKFVSSKLSFIDLSQSKINNLIIEENTVLNSCNFSQSEIINLVIMDMSLDGCLFNESKISEVSFSLIHPSTCSFSKSTIDQVSFDKCAFNKSNFSHSTFSDSIFTESKFSNANLTSTEFDNTSLLSIDFKKSNFLRSKIVKSLIENCDFSESNAIFLSINNSKVQNTKFDNSQIDLNIKESTILCCAFENLKTLVGRIQFDACKVEDATFTRHNLESFEIINQSNISKFKLTQCTFKSLVIDDSVLGSITFNNPCSIESFKVSKSKLGNCDFLNANIDKFEIQGSFIYNVNFRYTSIHKMSINNSEIKECDFSNASFGEVDFSNIDIESCIFEGVNYTINTKWPKNYDYKNKKLYGPYTILIGFNTIKNDLSKLDMQFSNLSKIQKEALVCNGTNFSDAKIEGCSFANGDFSHAFFSRASFKSTNLNNCNLSGAILDKSDLSGVRFNHCDLCGASFKDAIIDGTSFKRSKYDKNTIFPHEKFDPDEYQMLYVE